MKILENSFGLEKNKTTLSAELRAGMTTFMTMSYILIVQPIIMGHAGMPTDAVFTATAVFSAITTFVMGLYSKHPLALAPGMGMNAVFSFSLVNSGLATWEIALGIVFLSGVLFVLLSFPLFKPLRYFGIKNEKLVNFTLRKLLIDNIPISLKFGFAAVIGVFLLGLGLGNDGIGLTTAVNGQEIGDFSKNTTVIGIIGFLVTAIMFWSKGKLHVPGAILMVMLVVTIITVCIGDTPLPTAYVSIPPSMSEIAFKLDILGAIRIKYIPYILIFLLSDFLCTLGTTLACGTKAGLIDEYGNMMRIDRIFQVDSVATLVGSLFGVTTLTTYVESASGIEEGGRTGMTAVVVSVLFFASLLFSPIFLIVPSVATGIALIVVGLSMMQELRLVNFDDPIHWVPVLVMVAITAFSMDIASAICAGLIVYSVFAIYYRYVLKDKTVIVNVTTYILFLIAITQFVLIA